MRKLLFYVLSVLVFQAVCLIQPVIAIQDIDHPYFQSEEFKHQAEQLKSSKIELDKLNADLQSIQQERKQLTYVDLGILQILTSLPFFSAIILILFLSLIFATLYLYYLKTYNPTKWFICFKSSNNLKMLFSKIKHFNTLIILICIISFLLPSASLAATDIVTDAKLFFFGNEVERGYVYVKYPVKGRKLPYDNIKDIKIYPQFDDGSFEHQYNYQVHQFILGFPQNSAELVRLIEKAKSIDTLQNTYDFIFKINDDGMVKDIVLRRLSSLSKIKNEIKFVEIEAILSRAKASKRLNLIGEDIVATLNPMVADASGTSNYLQLAYILVDVDPNKAYELFERIKFRFNEIVGDNINESRFKTVYASLSKVRPELYKAGDSLQLDDQSDPTLVIGVASLFDSIDESLASMIIERFRIERSTKVNHETYDKLIYLWTKYRKADIPAFFNLFASEFIKTPHKNLTFYFNVARKLDYSKNDAIDVLFKADTDYYGIKSDNSTLITNELMELIGEDMLSKHFEYFKTRTAQASIILNTLFSKKYDLFLDYLKYCFGKDPHLIAGLSYSNKLAGFSKWDALISSQSLQSYRIPANYYLADKELSAPNSNLRKAKEIIQGNTDERLKSLIMSDNKLQDSDFLEELLLYFLYSKPESPQFADSRFIFETSIGEQTKMRLAQQVSSMKSEVQKARDLVESARSELNRIKSARMSAQVRVTVIWILTLMTIGYIVVAFFLSIKFSINSVASYSGTRVGLFAVVFAETFAKFLTPILYLTFWALLVIAVVQLYGFLRSKDGEFPNTQRALANYKDFSEKKASVSRR